MYQNLELLSIIAAISFQLSAISFQLEDNPGIFYNNASFKNWLVETRHGASLHLAE